MPINKEATFFSKRNQIPRKFRFKNNTSRRLRRGWGMATSCRPVTAGVHSWWQCELVSSVDRRAIASPFTLKLRANLNPDTAPLLSSAALAKTKSLPDRIFSVSNPRSFRQVSDKFQTQFQTCTRHIYISDETHVNPLV